MAKIKWFGHACFLIEVAGKKVLIDPWLNDNPKSPIKASDLTDINFVCVSHDHVDHIGDAVEICKRTEAVFVSIYDLVAQVEKKGVKNTLGMNIGGRVKVGDIYFTLIQAFHSSGVGSPTGFVIEGEGKSFYHAGDTGLFGDMKLIGELYKPKVAMLPIGGYYTMGPREASIATELIKPEIVIPMHYGTFPVLVQSADEFVKLVRERCPDVRVIVLNPGEEIVV